MTTTWHGPHARRREAALTVEQIRREQEALEVRIRLIEDLIAAIRREDLAADEEVRS